MKFATQMSPLINLKEARPRSVLKTVQGGLVEFYKTTHTRTAQRPAYLDKTQSVPPSYALTLCSFP